MCKCSGIFADVIVRNMSVTRYYVFVDDEAFEADGTAAVQAVGADAHFGTEAIAKSVGKPRGSIVYDGCRIHGLQKSLCGLLVFGYD